MRWDLKDTLHLRSQHQLKWWQIYSDKGGRQKEGIGQKLIDYCKSKYLLLKLDVFIKNKNAVNFYYKNGFKVLNEHFSEEANEIEYTMLYGNK